MVRIPTTACGSLLSNQGHCRASCAGCKRLSSARPVRKEWGNCEDERLKTCALRCAGIYGEGEQRHLPRIVVWLSLAYQRDNISLRLWLLNCRAILRGDCFSLRMALRTVWWSFCTETTLFRRTLKLLAPSRNTTRQLYVCSYYYNTVH